MKNEPKKVYLQVGDSWDGEDPEETDFKDLCEVNWCDDRIWPNDLEYVSVAVLRGWIDKSRKNADRIRREYPGTSHPATILMMIEELEKILSDD